MYAFSNDPARKLIVARMSGFFSAPEVDAFFTDEQRYIRDMGYASDQFALLIETEGSIVQSQDVVARFVERIADATLRARRIAVIRGSAISKLQTQRILSLRDNAAIFADRDEAMGWLFAD